MVVRERCGWEVRQPKRDKGSFCTSGLLSQGSSGGYLLAIYSNKGSKSRQELVPIPENLICNKRVLPAWIPACLYGRLVTVLV